MFHHKVFTINLFVIIIFSFNPMAGSLLSNQLSFSNTLKIAPPGHIGSINDGSSISVGFNFPKTVEESLYQPTAEMVLPAGGKNVRGVEEKDGYAYLLTRDGHLYTYNISNLPTITSFSTYNSPILTQALPNGNGLLKYGNYMYAFGDGGLTTLNIQNPKLPSVVRTQNDLAIYNLVRSNNYLIAPGQFGVAIYSISNPASPTLQTTFSLPNKHLYSAAVFGNYLYASEFEYGPNFTYPAGFRVFDFSNPQNLSLLHYTSRDFAAYHLKIVGNKLIECAEYDNNFNITSHIGIWSLDEPDNPVFQTSVDAYDRVCAVDGENIVTNGQVFHINGNSLELIDTFIPEYYQVDGYPFGSLVTPGFVFIAQSPRILILKKTAQTYPIIFIPGIMGSQLFSGSDSEPLWPNLCRIYGLNEGLTPLQLAPDGISPIPGAPADIHTIPGRNGVIERFTDQCLWPKIKNITYIDEPIYEVLINHFTAPPPSGLGYTEYLDFFVFNYDWRKNLTDAANDLEIYINQVLASSLSQKVEIVAHSMGGLVARQYILTPTNALKVDRLVTLGTPYLGTPKALAELLGLACALKDVPIVDSTGIKLVCIPNKETTSNLIANSPGAYELLPSQAYFQVKGSGFYSAQADDDVGGNCIHCLPFDQTYTNNLTSLFNNQVFDQADYFHYFLDYLSDWNGVKTSLIAGTGVQTIVGLRPWNLVNWGLFKYETPILPITNQLGDGTVTTLSAGLAGPQDNLRGTASFLEINKGDHGNLVKDTVSLAWLDYYLGLKANPPTSLAIQSIPTGVQIIASGIKILEAVDSSGNHTGSLPEYGLEETGIPGSFFFQEGGLASLSVVGEQNLTLTITPIGGQPIDLTVLRTAQDGSVSIKTYTGIPVSSSSRLSLIGDPAVMDTWQLDPDGTGTNLQSVNPTLSYNPGESVDLTPPELAVSIDGTPGLQGWYTSPIQITLQATDLGSGVQRIEYAFSNDRSPRIYTGSFTADPAQVGVLMAVAVDNAGNVQSLPAMIRIGPERQFVPSVKK